jgi:hypothetical protein
MINIIQNRATGHRQKIIKILKNQRKNSIYDKKINIWQKEAKEANTQKEAKKEANN